MPSDRLVTATHVLKAVMELDRRGTTQAMSELEKLEPDMVEYLLESLTRLHHQLMDLGLSRKDTRKAYHRAEKTALVCIMSLRQAYRELLDDQAGTPTPTAIQIPTRRCNPSSCPSHLRESAGSIRHSKSGQQPSGVLSTADEQTLTDAGIDVQATCVGEFGGGGLFVTAKSVRAFQRPWTGSSGNAKRSSINAPTVRRPDLPCSRRQETLYPMRPPRPWRARRFP